MVDGGADAGPNAIEGGFPAFPEDCRSLLKKHLTRDVWMQLKDRRTGAGVTLHDCIRSGVANPDSAVGLYAGDAESYDLFAPLFAPVIADCHAGFAGGGARRGAAGDFRSANPDPEARYIVSTRIRVTRNLQGYGLRPAATREVDRDVEREARNAFAAFSGDLAGGYREMDRLNSAERGHSFSRGDRFQEAAGLNRHWPDGRGVFANIAGTFVCWVNDEDHLRFISLQPGADLTAVYARLCKGLEMAGRSLAFQHSDRYGHLSSCPTNLGTGLRASFHLRLPLSGGTPAFMAICRRRHLEVRGTAGEHSAVAGHVYDISNKRRLGLPEAECLEECLEGAVELINLEKSLAEKS